MFAFQGKQNGNKTFVFELELELELVKVIIRLPAQFGINLHE